MWEHAQLATQREQAENLRYEWDEEIYLAE